ncbi:MAG: hypothetical protein IKS71_01830 [Bacteroidales bacterium]|nr:hypothetical protein [Bacteroidales bacterium]
MSFKEILGRYSTATVGLLFIALGIAFAVQSNLGVSALNGVQYAFAVKYPRFSFGDFNFGLFSLLILVQLAVLRKDFQLIDLLQLVANALLGYMVDNFVWTLNHLGLVPDTLELRFFYILVSCIVTAFGVSVEVAAKAWMLPAEMTVNAFTRAFGGKFGNNKVIMDCTLLVISGILCLVFWKNILGPGDQPILGIGTLVSAVAVGLMMRLTDPLVNRFVIRSRARKIYRFRD